MRIPQFYGTWALVLSFLFLFACETSDTGEDFASNETTRVEVEEFQFTREPSGARYFTGELRNNSERDMPVAQIQVSLLDEQDRQVSTASIEVREIPAGETKSFREVLDSDEEFAGARVRSVLVP